MFPPQVLNNRANAQGLLIPSSAVCALFDGELHVGELVLLLELLKPRISRLEVHKFYILSDFLAKFPEDVVIDFEFVASSSLDPFIQDDADRI